jgi:hypothetical protein
MCKNHWLLGLPAGMGQEVAMAVAAAAEEVTEVRLLLACF